MNDYKILLNLEKTLLKNYIKGIISNPKRLIAYAVYIALMSWVLINNTRNVGSSTSPSNLANIKLYAGAGALVLITMMSYGLLKKSSLYFKMADINLMFTAPIDQRKILMVTLLKRIPTYLLTSVYTLIFLLSMFIKLFEPTTAEVLITGFGYTIVFLILEPLSFCIFIISTKLKRAEFRDRMIKGLFIVTFILIASAVTQSVMANGTTFSAILEGLNNKALDFIPIIGWAKHLTITVVTGTTGLTYWFLGLMTLSYFAIVLFTFYLGNDYFEDVIQGSEERDKLIKSAKAGRVKWQGFHFKKKHINIKDDAKYSDAIHWKRKLMLKRSDFSVYFSIETILCVLVTIGLIVFTDGRVREFGPYITCGGYFYMKFLFSMQTQLDQELKMPFFYLIPDTPMKKIVSSVKVDVLRFMINTVVLTSVHILWTQYITPEFFILPFAVTLFYIVMLFSSYFFNIFLPPEDFERLQVMFKMLQTILILLPSLAVLLLIGIFTENALMAISGSMIVNLLLSIVFLALSETLFNRLELK